jgi:hypothetical protein
MATTKLEQMASKHITAVWYGPELYREMRLGDYPPFMEKVFLAGAEAMRTLVQEHLRDANELEAVEYIANVGLELVK